MKTCKAIKQSMLPYGFARIPEGTPVTPATNLPRQHPHHGYWAEPWEGMTEQEESWQRNYGFYVYPWEVKLGD